MNRGNMDETTEEKYKRLGIEPTREFVSKCREDLFFFAKEILGYEKMTLRTHQDICTFTKPLLGYRARYRQKKGYDDEFDRKKNRVLILMPRGTFKSSVVTISFALQYILNEPNARILIDSETHSKAKAFLREIIGHLEQTEKFRELFKLLFNKYPDESKRSLLWTDSAIVLPCRFTPKKEPTISVGGVDTTKTGMHYDLIIADDLHSDVNTQNLEQIEKVKDHYKLYNSLLDPGKPLIVIGTRWHYNDTYQHILDYEREDYNTLIRQAYNPDGSLFFPEVLTKKELDNLKRRLGSYIFSCQYMNSPVDDETAIFRRSWIKYVTEEEIRGRPINWYLMVDPSYEGKDSDYAAFVVAGMDFMQQIYVKHVTRAKMTYGEIIQHIFSLYHKYNPKRISLETLASAKSIQYELTNEQRNRGLWLPILEIKHRSRSKEERVRGLAPAYEFGRVFHLQEADTSELEYEMLHFPKAKHDDVIDALADIYELATPPSRDQAQRAERKRKFKVFDKPRSPLTGI